MKNYLILGVFLFASLVGAPRVFAFSYSSSPVEVSHETTWTIATDDSTSLYFFAFNDIDAGSVSCLLTAGSCNQTIDATIGCGGGACVDGNEFRGYFTDIGCSTEADCIVENQGTTTQVYLGTVIPTPEGATSTMEQTQQNVAVGFALWLASFVIVVWITQDKRARI